MELAMNGPYGDVVDDEHTYVGVKLPAGKKVEIYERVEMAGGVGVVIFIARGIKAHCPTCACHGTGAD
jgi:hypothetical protein